MDNRIIVVPAPVAPARLARVLLIAVVLALPLGGAPLLAWTQTLPDGYGMQDLAQAWRDVAFGGLYRQLRAGIRAAEGLRF